MQCEGPDRKLSFLCGRSRHFLPRLKAAAQAAVKELFCAAVKIQKVLRTREAVAFIGINHKRDFASVLSNGGDDLLRLCQFHPRIELPVANQQRYTYVTGMEQR